MHVMPKFISLIFLGGISRWSLTVSMSAFISQHEETFGRLRWCPGTGKKLPLPLPDLLACSLGPGLYTLWMPVDSLGLCEIAGWDQRQQNQRVLTDSCLSSTGHAAERDLAWGDGLQEGLGDEHQPIVTPYLVSAMGGCADGSALEKHSSGFHGSWGVPTAF